MKAVRCCDKQIQVADVPARNAAAEAFAIAANRQAGAIKVVLEP